MKRNLSFCYAHCVVNVAEFAWWCSSYGLSSIRKVFSSLVGSMISVYMVIPFPGCNTWKINAPPSDLGLFVSWFLGEMWSGGSTAVQLRHSYEIDFPLYHTILMETRYGGTTGKRRQMPSEAPILQKPNTKGNLDAGFFKDCWKGCFFAQSNICYTLFSYTGARNRWDKLGGQSTTGIQQLNLCNLSQLSLSYRFMTTEDLLPSVVTAIGQSHISSIYFSKLDNFMTN